MADTGDKKYNITEALNRLYRALIGSVNPNDAPGTISGVVLSDDEAISKIAELAENNLAGKTGQVPDGWTVPAAGIAQRLGQKVVAIAVSRGQFLFVGLPRDWPSGRGNGLGKPLPTNAWQSRPECADILRNGAKKPGFLLCQRQFDAFSTVRRNSSLYRFLAAVDGEESTMAVLRLEAHHVCRVVTNHATEKHLVRHDPPPRQQHPASPGGVAIEPLAIRGDRYSEAATPRHSLRG